MFSKQVFMKQRAMQAIFKQTSLVNKLAYFSTTNAGAETVVNEQDFYSPTKEVNIAKGTYVIFDNKLKGGWKYGAPYEVKETVLKNSLGVIVTSVIEHNLLPMMYIPTTYFALNMLYRVASYMTRAIDHLELLNCGTKVKVQYKIGGKDILNISDIRKVEDEKALVETFAEPYLYPISIRGKGVYYLYGNGHSAIKDGELFRAIVNGKSILLD